MTIGSTQRRTQERGHGQSLFILLLAPCNTPPACNVGGACSMAPANPPRDQATASWRKTSFQRRTPRAAVRHTHPSGRPPVTRTGDEPFRRRPSDQAPPRPTSCAGGLVEPVRIRLLFTCSTTGEPNQKVTAANLASFLDIPLHRSEAQGAPQGRVVELVGIEPTTPCLQSRCSPS